MSPRTHNKSPFSPATPASAESEPFLCMALATQLSLDEILTDIGLRVVDSVTPVTYRWLAQHYRAPAEISKRILQEFVNRNEDSVEVVYYLSGRDKDGRSIGQMIDSQKMEDAKKMIDVSSIHVHSVRRRPEKKDMSMDSKSDLSVILSTIHAVDMTQQRNLRANYLKQLKNAAKTDKNNNSSADIKGNCMSHNRCSSVRAESIERLSVKFSFSSGKTETKPKPAKRKRPEKKKSAFDSFSPAGNDSEKKQKLKGEAKKVESKTKTDKNATKQATSSPKEKPEKSEGSSQKPNASKEKFKPKSAKKTVKKKSSGSSRLAMMFAKAASMPKKPKREPKKEEPKEEIEEINDTKSIEEEDQARATGKEAGDKSHTVTRKSAKKRRKKRKSSGRKDDDDDAGDFEEASKKKKKRKRKKKKEVIESSDDEDDLQEEQTLEEMEELHYEVIKAQENFAERVAATKAQEELDEENLSEEELPEAENFKSFFTHNEAKKKIKKIKEIDYFGEDGYMHHSDVEEEIEVDIELPKKDDKPKADASPKSAPKNVDSKKNKKKLGKKNASEIMGPDGDVVEKDNSSKKSDKKKGKKPLPPKPVEEFEDKKPKKQKTMLSFFQRK